MVRKTWMSLLLIQIPSDPGFNASQVNKSNQVFSSEVQLMDEFSDQPFTTLKLSQVNPLFNWNKGQSHFSPCKITAKYQPRLARGWFKYNHCDHHHDHNYKYKFRDVAHSQMGFGHRKSGKSVNI